MSKMQAFWWKSGGKPSLFFIFLLHDIDTFAEEEGFEPSVHFHAHTLSRRAN